MRKRTSLAAASGAFAITAALSVATAGLAGATAVPQPAAAASTAAMPAAPAYAAPATVPARHATIPAAPLITPTPPVTHKPAAPAAKTPAGGVSACASLTVPTGGTTCSGADHARPPRPARRLLTRPVTFDCYRRCPLDHCACRYRLTPVLLGADAAGDIVAHDLGTGAAGDVTVTDDRALLDASWDRDCPSRPPSPTQTTGSRARYPGYRRLLLLRARAGTTIGVGTAGTADIVIAPGQPLTAGTAPTAGITTGTAAPGANGSAAALGGTAPTACALSAGVGANQVTWHPTVAVDIPATAVSGTYQGTITHSVA